MHCVMALNRHLAAPMYSSSATTIPRLLGGLLSRHRTPTFISVIQGMLKWIYACRITCGSTRTAHTLILVPQNYKASWELRGHCAWQTV